MSEHEAQQRAIESVNALRYAGEEYFFIIDRNGEMISHPIKPSLNGKSATGLKDIHGKLFIREMISTTLQEGSSFTDYYWTKPGGTEPIAKVSYAVIEPRWGWIIATGVYVDDIEGLFWADIRTSVVLSVLLTALAIVMCTLISKVISSEVKTLCRAMTTAADNRDMTVRANLDSQDEFGQMGRAFDQMMSQFNLLIIDITSSATQVAGAATELSATTTQTSAGVVQQQQQTIQVATAMNQMNATVHEVSRNISAAAEASHLGAQATSTGKQVVDQTVSAIHQLSQQLQSTADLTSTLDTESNNVTRILEVINGIAEQTNLLALNAAIEAARAGEQGRGFAVVADEVRTLALRTSDSTREIETVIQRLQSGARNAAEAITNSNSEAIATVEQAVAAGDALQVISNSIDEIDSMTVQISAASDQQTTVTDEMSRSIDSISQVTGEYADSSGHIARASEELAELAEHLRKIAGQFRVSVS